MVQAIWIRRLLFLRPSDDLNWYEAVILFGARQHTNIWIDDDSFSKKNTSSYYGDKRRCLLKDTKLKTVPIIGDI